MNFSCNIRRIALALAGISLAATVVAQPPRRRNQMTTAAASQTATAQQQNAPKGSSYRQFPTAQNMPTDAAWRRDLYLTLELSKEKNAVLYYPATPQNGCQNLFSYLFKLILRKQIKAYEYNLDGNEDFSAKNVLTPKKIMDDRDIFYEEKDGKFRVSDADIPSDQVKAYFIKQSTYYDQHTASFRTKVTAICPVLRPAGLEGDYAGDFGQYPMFWLNMEEIAPYLGKLMLMSSSLNNAATMSADDYFTMGLYEGDIYKTVELQDRLLSTYCPTDTAIKKEQKRIEGQITNLEDHVWGRDLERRRQFVADSIAKAQAAADTLGTKKSARSATRRPAATRRSSSSAATVSAAPAKAKATKQRTAKTSSSRSSGLSVRRQRH